MGFSFDSTTRAIENSTRWKELVGKTSVVLQRPREVMDRTEKNRRKKNMHKKRLLSQDQLLSECVVFQKSLLYFAAPLR